MLVIISLILAITAFIVCCFIVSAKVHMNILEEDEAPILLILIPICVGFWFITLPIFLFVNYGGKFIAKQLQSFEIRKKDDIHN